MVGSREGVRAGAHIGHNLLGLASSKTEGRKLQLGLSRRLLFRMGEVFSRQRFWVTIG